MLYVCRVPALVVLAIVLAGGQVEQMHEVVRVHLLDLNEAADDSHVLANLAAIYAGLFLLSWTVLFWSEYALASRFPSSLANNHVLRMSYAALPALLAYLPWLGGALAIANANFGLNQSTHVLAVALGWSAVGLGIGCIATFYSKRARAAIQRRHGTAPREASEPFGQFDWLMLSLFVGLGLFLLALASPGKMGAWLGTIGTMLAACVAIVPALTWLTASPRIPRWHWLTLLVGIAFLWSAFDLNDNHELRELSDRTAFVNAPGYGQSFQEWLLAREPQSTKEPFPVVFVAAEGGGIRAAYFTAQVLAAIQDRCPEFARHLFAISGVSGGSVGAALFAGMLDALPERAVAERLDCSQRLPKSTPFGERTEQVLKTDFLGPLSATLLFPDAFQRFLPFPVPAWDRARTLEASVEDSFQTVVGTDFMKRSLYSYWSPQRNTPLLLLNTTHVETGNRTVASPLILLEERFHRLTTLFDFVPSADFRISTVAVTSARFPLVTPAGAVVNGDRKLRFVDGGYFENSGAVTLAEAIDVAMQAAHQINRTIRPVVIRIGNSPSMLAATENRPASSEVEGAPPMGLGELMSPVRAMFNTRNARGVLAAQALESTVTTLQDNGVPSDYVEFQMGVDSVQIPLGWQLSMVARKALRAQLNVPESCTSRNGIINGCGVTEVVDVLANWSIP